MRASFLGALSVAALAVSTLTGCAALKDGAQAPRLTPDPAACSKDKSDDDCVLGVKVTKVGAADCTLEIDKKTTSTVALKPARTSGQKRFVVWQLTGDVSNEAKDRIEWAADVGVYPLPGQNPGDAEFTDPRRRSHDQFEWARKASATKGDAVSYNFLVTRTTRSSGGGNIVRVCSFTDPVIYNTD